MKVMSAPMKYPTLNGTTTMSPHAISGIIKLIISIIRSSMSVFTSVPRQRPRMNESNNHAHYLGKKISEFIHYSFFEGRKVVVLVLALKVP